MRHQYVSNGKRKHRIEIDRRGVFVRKYRIVDRYDRVRLVDLHELDDSSEVVEEILTYSVVETPVVREITL